MTLPCLHSKSCISLLQKLSFCDRFVTIFFTSTGFNSEADITYCLGCSGKAMFPRGYCLKRDFKGSVSPWELGEKRKKRKGV